MAYNISKINYWVAVFLIPIFVVYLFLMVNFYWFSQSQQKEWIESPLLLIGFQNSIYFVLNVSLLAFSYLSRVKNKFSLKWLMQLTHGVGAIIVITFFMELYFSFLPYKIMSQRYELSSMQLFYYFVKTNALKFVPLFCSLICVGIFRQVIKRKQFDDREVAQETSGNFGTASWVTKKDMEFLNAYEKQNCVLIGADLSGKMLYLPLSNKLTISPPGGGKTTASSIPVLLTHEGPVFVFDIKGELWAVTARYRAEVLGRHVVVIDPFGITRGNDFAKDKSPGLLKEYCLNPFDWVPEDQRQRDRMINAFASSFVINEGGHATHFDENAKILIRGYIDYMMSRAISDRSLSMLYHLMSEREEEAEATFDQMSQLAGRAAAAANQINRVGMDEKGSILSTSYRQIDWMGDSNIQKTLSMSNFDLRDFLKGNMDIFIVLPEDQVKEHNRLVRMIMSLIMGLIVQANPSDLPKNKILFLLEELAQLGYCPDVEQAIEVLRARGVVVWTVFQTLSQIELFQKPDLFKGAMLKQIFTNDDTKTMEWIQTLGGKKTVITKTISTNKGDSRQKMQVFGGSISSGEGESVHETGVDLIQVNEIREMPSDEQFVFLQGTRPMRCKKVRYFEHPDFFGKFDSNPLEMKDRAI